MEFPENEADRQWKEMIAWQLKMVVWDSYLRYELKRPYLSRDGLDTSIRIVSQNWEALEPVAQSRFVSPSQLEPNLPTLEYGEDEKREALEWVAWRKSDISEWWKFEQAGMPGLRKLRADWLLTSEDINEYRHEQTRQEEEQLFAEKLDHAARQVGIEKFFD